MAHYITGHLIEADKCTALQINKGNYSGKAIISPEAINELNWWVSSIRHAHNNLTTSDPTLTLCTDASMLGGVQ